jgi:hypothetical protein
LSARGKDADRRMKQFFINKHKDRQTDTYTDKPTDRHKHRHKHRDRYLFSLELLAEVKDVDRQTKQVTINRQIDRLTDTERQDRQ